MIIQNVNMNIQSQSRLTSSYKKMEQPNKYNVNFNGYLGVEKYGTEEIRRALEYKVKLTPIKMDFIMDSAKSTDEGLKLIYEEMNNESKNIDKAFKGFYFINKQRAVVADRRLSCIDDSFVGKTKPKVVKYTKNLATRITGGRTKLEKGVNELLEDYNGIGKKYIIEGLLPLLVDYAKINEYFQEGIEYVIMQKGNSPFREKLLENTRKMVDKYEEPTNKLIDKLDKQGDNIVARGEKIMDNYSNQSITAALKANKWINRILIIISSM